MPACQLSCLIRVSSEHVLCGLGKTSGKVCGCKCCIHVRCALLYHGLNRRSNENYCRLFSITIICLYCTRNDRSSSNAKTCPFMLQTLRFLCSQAFIPWCRRICNQISEFFYACVYVFLRKSKIMYFVPRMLFEVREARSCVEFGEERRSCHHPPRTAPLCRSHAAGCKADFKKHA